MHQRTMASGRHIDMDVHMGCRRLAAGMGMQERHQALQERQGDDQAIISEILFHRRILISIGQPHQSFAVHRAWQSRLAQVGCPGAIARGVCDNTQIGAIATSMKLISP